MLRPLGLAAGVNVGAVAPGSSVPVAVALTLPCVGGGGVVASAHPHGVRCRLAEAGVCSSRSDETAESRPKQALTERSEEMGEKLKEASPPASGTSSGASIARCLYRPPIATAAVSATPKFSQMTKGGYKDGETGSQDWGNTGNCAGGDWSDKGTYWYQGPCNGGASWLTANGLAGSTDDYEFTVSIWNEDDDDSGVVWRYTDKQNYVRFHHTLNNAYNSGRKPALLGCQGLGSFVVVRKAGKEIGRASCRERV